MYELFPVLLFGGLFVELSLPFWIVKFDIRCDMTFIMVVNYIMGIVIFLYIDFPFWIVFGMMSALFLLAMPMMMAEWDRYYWRYGL